MRLLVLGDTHADTDWLTDYIFPAAVELDVDAIVQVGDYGFWEHEREGVTFNDTVSRHALRTKIPFYFLRGNHDNLSLLLRSYGHQLDPEGFVVVRPNLLFIPDGHTWTWGGVRMRAFGGAYSIDKDWRLKREAALQRSAIAEELTYGSQGRPALPVRQYAGTLWFPDEELTDAEFAKLLAEDSSPVDVVFSHDRPRSANPGRPLKDDPHCHVTQDNLQRVLTTLKPPLWIHGHLHHRYTDVVLTGEDTNGCVVVGLGCNLRAADRFAKPWHAYGLLDIAGDGSVSFIDGAAAEDSIGGNDNIRGIWGYR